MIARTRLLSLLSSLKRTNSTNKVLLLPPHSVCQSLGRSSVEQCASIHLPLKDKGIIWRKPEILPYAREKSGDLEAWKKPDKNIPVIRLFIAKEEIERLDEVTKKLISLEYFERWETEKVSRRLHMDAVRRHQLDTGSLEARIAALTVQIRVGQERLSEERKETRVRERYARAIDRQRHHERYVLLKVQTLESIAKRKKYLRRLRERDYKRFEYLLDELNILYQPDPSEKFKLERTDCIKRLVALRAEQIYKERMDEYRQKLDSQKESFKKEKEETLKWIAETEAKIADSSDEEIQQA